eukprot:CAMPEP_0168781940 /NCGR_PEP_ID=MMETSP0725-20121227/8901_1 /TAXON_ID=265536 /ORGANISM="Amphiprora sp., Strain CCMP467" /LENGTH=380 /DNA_ID=CAMNT_0008831845 /DNA_START=190 /DNA_END=1332 /DNA_ORIENTATION=+
MKIVGSSTIVLLAGSASAFTSSPIRQQPASSLTAVQVKEGQNLEVELQPPSIEEETQVIEEPVAVAAAAAPKEESIKPGRYADLDRSLALPFLKRPTKLDGSHAGDYGFDPLGFTETYDLYTMQEAEIRHARLAMLAVVGWPLSELVAPDWMLQENGCAPSVLNGFNPLTFFTTVVIFGAFGLIEKETSLRMNTETRLGKIHRQDMKDVWSYGVAGDYDFDPLDLYNKIGNDPMSRKGLRDVEISHGRPAMLAISFFAFWEALTGHAVTESFGMFFHPNLVLPLLTFGYFFFNAVYEVENTDQYVLQVRKTSEGEAYLENLKLSLPGAGSGSGMSSEETMELLTNVSEKAKELLEKAQNFYGTAQESYLEYSTKNMAGAR